LIRSVVGVTPSGSTRSPSSALMKLDLPELNSPGDDQQEELVELRARLPEVAQVVGRDVRLESLQRLAQPLEQLLLARPQLLLALRCSP
jgi:hypothetical protein